ncbi:MAG: hypothetical protein QS748_02345 [Candidatus Endonucleobacter bathymodioli]|uniref:Uncharacterized protein n=1 Tax=Candidatus Endonucleibacter bathymodioli TaxID=539814 RepID=A0AA90NTU0_9GAMM|nr:hypothetical protein [Candidatus Endonucleobacter bathymodioli]
MNISNYTPPSLSGSVDMAPMQAEEQSTEVENNVLPVFLASPPSSPLAESRNLKSRDVISTKFCTGLIQSNSEPVEQQSAKVESILAVIPHVEVGEFTSLDWFEVLQTPYYRNLSYFYFNKKSLVELSDSV